MRVAPYEFKIRQIRFGDMLRQWGDGKTEHHKPTKQRQILWQVEYEYNASAEDFCTFCR